MKTQHLLQFLLILNPFDINSLISGSCNRRVLESETSNEGLEFYHPCKIRKVLGLRKVEELEIRAPAKLLCPKALGSSKEVCNYLDQQVEKKKGGDGSKFTLPS